ncbi:MAG: Glycosyl transferase, family 2 [uncultured bacterium]|nr:MAG: Glycosyl transferase, family 2 [uncultured bacterium]
MTNKKLTICIPTYNRKKFVCELVNSIIESDLLSTVDLIVIDDGSSDDTFDALNKIEYPADANVRFMYQENRGFTGTTLSFFSNCQTEYLMLADDDMVIVPDGIPKLIDFINEIKPDFASPVWLCPDGATISRGRRTLEKITIPDFRMASDHGPGLVYRITTFQSIVEQAIDSIKLEPNGVAKNFPLLYLMLYRSLYSDNFWWCPISTCGYRKTGAEPNFTVDIYGDKYGCVVPRWREHKSLAALYFSLIEKTRVNLKKQSYQKLLTMHNYSVYTRIRSSVAAESPELLPFFDGGSIFHNIRYFYSRIGAFLFYAKERWLQKKVFVDEER